MLTLKFVAKSGGGLICKVRSGGARLTLQIGSG